MSSTLHVALPLWLLLFFETRPQFSSPQVPILFDMQCWPNEKLALGTRLSQTYILDLLIVYYAGLYQNCLFSFSRALPPCFIVKVVKLIGLHGVHALDFACFLLLSVFKGEWTFSWGRNCCGKVTGHCWKVWKDCLTLPAFSVLVHVVQINFYPIRWHLLLKIQTTKSQHYYFSISLHHQPDNGLEQYCKFSFSKYWESVQLYCPYYQYLWISFYGAYLSSFHKLFHSPRLAFFYYNILHVLTGEMWELVFKTETIETTGSLVLTP